MPAPVLRTRFLHEGWELSVTKWLTPNKRMGYSVLEWLPATVPGHVHPDLVRHGVNGQALQVVYSRPDQEAYQHQN